MATKKEPEYMELTKETTKEKKENTEPHIYELDVPKVPQSTEPAEDKKDQVSLQYHYVTDTRGIKVPVPNEPVEKEEEKEKKEQHQYHYIDNAETKKVRPLSKLASQEVRSKIKETLEEKISKGQQRQRRCSVKYVAFTVLFLLTVLNTLVATAALAIGGILYSRMGTIQNGTTSQMGYFNT